MSSFFRSAPSTTSSIISNRGPPSTVLATPALASPGPARPTRARALPDSEHRAAYDELFAVFSAPDFELPVRTGGAADVAQRPLSRSERMWLTEDCFLRYLRAQKWSVAVARSRLEETLVWRREVGLADWDGGESSPEEGGGLSRAFIDSEGVQGKDYVNGWDEQGRPLHYQIPSKNTNTHDSKLNVLYCVWVMERSIDLMPPGVEKQVLLVNFSGGMSPPPIATVRGWIGMLSSHYPERMGKAIAIKVPWILNAFFKLILPLIDPVTRAKLAFNEPAPWVPAAQLDASFEPGSYQFSFDWTVYADSLTALCAAKRREHRERWLALGSPMGASEWVLRGGATDATDQEDALAWGSSSPSSKTEAVDALQA